MFLCAGVLAWLAGCAPRVAPILDLRPGMGRDQTISALRRHGYCRLDRPVRKTETYHPCNRTGAHLGYSWVVVEYDSGTLYRLQRFEGHDRRDAAAERWQHLVLERNERYGPPSPMARRLLLDVRGEPAGARSWADWYSSDYRVLVGVYQLRAGD